MKIPRPVGSELTPQINRAGAGLEAESRRCQRCTVEFELQLSHRPMNRTRVKKHTHKKNVPHQFVCTKQSMVGVKQPEGSEQGSVINFDSAAAHNDNRWLGILPSVSTEPVRLITHGLVTLDIIYC